MTSFSRFEKYVPKFNSQVEPTNNMSGNMEIINEDLPASKSMIQKQLSAINDSVVPLNKVMNVHYRNSTKPVNQSAFKI